MLAVVKSTGLFFSGSPKRTRHLEKTIEAVNTQHQEDNRDNLLQIRLHKLTLQCETRCVGRLTTLDDFIVLYEPLLDWKKRRVKCQQLYGLYKAKTITRNVNV